MKPINRPLAAPPEPPALQPPSLPSTPSEPFAPFAPALPVAPFMPSVPSVPSVPLHTYCVESISPACRMPSPAVPPPSPLSRPLSIWVPPFAQCALPDARLVIVDRSPTPSHTYCTLTEASAAVQVPSLFVSKQTWIFVPPATQFAPLGSAVTVTI